MFALLGTAFSRLGMDFLYKDRPLLFTLCTPPLVGSMQLNRAEPACVRALLIVDALLQMSIRLPGGLTKGALPPEGVIVIFIPVYVLLSKLFGLLSYLSVRNRAFYWHLHRISPLITTGAVSLQRERLRYIGISCTLERYPPHPLYCLLAIC